MGDSPAFEFYMPTFRNSVCSIFVGGVKKECKIQNAAKYFKSRISQFFDKVWQMLEDKLWTSRISNREAHSQACSVIVNKRGCLCCGMRCGIKIEVCSVVDIISIALVSTWRSAQQQVWEGSD